MKSFTFTTVTTALSGAIAFSLSLAIAFSLSLPNQAALAESLTAKTPVILDDDGGPDGMIAWSYILANPQFDVQALTIAQGIARPNHFVDNVERMLGRLDITGIPVGVGRPDPLASDNEFPAFIRDGSDTFWSPFVTLPDDALTVERREAAELIVETVQNSPYGLNIQLTPLEATNQIRFSPEDQIAWIDT